MKFPLLASLPALLSGLAAAAPLTREVVATGFHDPMCIAIAPDGDLYLTEREGKLFRVRPSTGGVFQIGTIPVEALRAKDPNSTYAREDGLQGVALDPEFAKNGRIYLYYSAPEKLCNRLSRFEIRDGKLDPATERMLLEVPTERANKVCHHGGNLRFGPDGLLYLSTGDNTNPFESSGFNPIDDRDGHEYANAMRSAGNSNDLRGKILRIRPTEKGYEIPKGNLFPAGTAKTRPEIYVMGCRNPFRFSIDTKNSTLYWGEVGPDSAKDGDRGPMGYDEVNQARSAGYYGWPFIIANNQPYARFDFATNTVHEKFDPAAPVNPSKHNTGITNLPPARPAFIWYPYGDSPDFPVMGKGGRNAMAGPVFYHDPSRKYNILDKDDDHTLLTYEWMRGKIYKAKLGAEEKLEKLEVLAEGFVHPMDLDMAADGSLWMLEYGKDWWFNKDGKITRLLPDTGNKSPKLAIEPVTGPPGRFQVKSSEDPDGDPVTISWWLTDGITEHSLGTGPLADLAGRTGSEVRAVATDGKGGSAIARISLLKEETVPQLMVKITGAPPTLSFGQEIGFTLAGAPSLDAAQAFVRVRFIPEGHETAGPGFTPDIEKLATARLCLACHQVSQPSVGPQYLNVALKYRDRADAADYLKGKLKNGSTGAWGEIPMPPQIAVTDPEADAIVRAILGLSEGISEARGVAQGKLKLPPKPASATTGGAWEITAEAPGHAPAKSRIPVK